MGVVLVFMLLFKITRHPAVFRREVVNLGKTRRSDERAKLQWQSGNRPRVLRNLQAVAAEAV